MELNESIFAIEPNVAAMHLVVRSILANKRQGTQSALTRGMVRGGGRKIYRQKGTGNARHHGNRAPQFAHGGVVFAPQPRDYVINVPKKVRRLALKSALTEKFNAGEIVVVDQIKFEEVKTKYSHDERRASANAPVFADDAQITYKKGLINATVTVPQAAVEDGNEVYIYRIAVKNNAGETLYAAWEFSEYYFAERPDTISFKFSMPDGAAYAEVVAEDAWGNQSAALVYNF